MVGPLPGGDIVSGRDGDALPPGSVPGAVRVPGQDALPARVAIATAVGERQPLDLHRCPHVEVSLEEEQEITDTSLHCCIVENCRHDWFYKTENEDVQRLSSQGSFKGRRDPEATAFTQTLD